MDRRSVGFTLVELMIVVAVIGILAAIAVPAFLRYIKSSKAAEAEPILRSFTNGAKAYFTSEQAFSAPVNGAEPWHVADASHPPGFPVAFSQKVFPGGNGLEFSTAVVGGDGWVSSFSAPRGGEKQIPFGDVQPSFPGITAALNKLNVNLEDPTYFAYSYGAYGFGYDARVDVQASANFDPSDAAMHTVFTGVTVSENGEVRNVPPATQNEFR